MTEDELDPNLVAGSGRRVEYGIIAPPRFYNPAIAYAQQSRLEADSS
jgi:hypothetical protein